MRPTRLRHRTIARTARVPFQASPRLAAPSACRSAA